MVKGLYTAYTGMVNEQKRMDVMTLSIVKNCTAKTNTVTFMPSGITDT